jgi:hypothetical protein
MIALAYTAYACYSKLSNYYLALLIIAGTTTLEPFTVNTANSDAFSHSCAAFPEHHMPCWVITQ